MSDVGKKSVRVVGWTLLQATVFILVFELGLSWWRDAQGLRFDIGRGVLWHSYTYGFIASAGCANVLLTMDRVGTVRLTRIATWALAFLPLVLLTLPSWSSLPLAVPFIHGCAVFSVIVREVLGSRIAQRRAGDKPVALV